MQIGFLIYPDLTHLDLAGPHEILARLPGAKTCLVGKTLNPVLTDTQLVLKPDQDFNSAPPLDVLVVPGGPGVNPLLNDAQTLSWLKKCASEVQYMTSVCTGALLLAAAGLLKGRRATTHWSALEFLSCLGAIPVKERIVIDGPFITGGGVTAGIDFGLKLVSELADENMAKKIQLALEYDPHPPFNAGSPETAGETIVEKLRQEMSESVKVRTSAVEQAFTRLAGESGADNSLSETSRSLIL